MSKSLQRCQTATKDPKQTSCANFIESSNKENKVEIKGDNQQNAAYVNYMKYLISSNADYFQSKLEVNNKCRPKELRFKMPIKTGGTIYQREYKQKSVRIFTEQDDQLNWTADCIKTNHFYEGEKKMNLTFQGKTMYQKEFIPMKIIKRPLEKRPNMIDNSDGPRFFQTQNKTQFLNWGGQNFAPSMKPSHKSAVTNAPFQSTSVYKLDFSGKKGKRAKAFIRQASFPKFSNMNMVLESNYSSSYGLKKSKNIEIDCKPKHTMMNTNIFKGTTEYKSEFQTKKQEDTLEPQKKTVEELQALIIDL